MKVFVFFLFLIQSSFAFNNPIFTRKEIIIGMPLVLVNYNNNYNKPVVVIGGSGYTGSDCVKNLVNNKNNVISLSRNPILIPDIDNSFVDYVSADITKKETIENAIKGSEAVIFTANAIKKSEVSGKGNDFNNHKQSFTDIAIMGLINVAKSCIKNDVKRLVVISASCMSCQENPSAKFDKACGLSCVHCTAKQEGEKALKELYANNNKCSYTIIRAGLLTTGEKRGPTEIEINQDFTKTGMISRIDLADIAINSINNPNTFGTTFEAYYRDTIQPIDVKKSLETCVGLGKTMEECFFGSYFKNKKPSSIDEAIKAPIQDTLFATGNEFNGKNWDELFRNLKKDKNEYIDLFNLETGIS